MEKETSNIIVDFIAAIATVIILLKFCAVIRWSWLWVLSPLWIPGLILSSLKVIGVLIKISEIPFDNKKPT